MAVRNPLVLVGGQVSELPPGDILAGVPLTIKVAKFSIVGEFPSTAMAPTARWYPEGAITILGVYFSIGEAASGSCIAQLSKNGVNILPGNLLITAGNYKSDRLTPASPTAVSTDYFMVGFRSMAGGGANATLCVEYQQTD